VTSPEISAAVDRVQAAALALDAAIEQQRQAVLAVEASKLAVKVAQGTYDNERGMLLSVVVKVVIPDKV
jgi:hypothetical protein